MKNNTDKIGLDRSKQQSNDEVKKKEDTKSKIDLKDEEYIINILKKLPIFTDLTDYHIKKILNICNLKKFQKDQYVCDEEDKSNEMYIFLSDQLKVVYHGSTLLTYISPINIVGELVFFTGEQGLSSVIATKDSTVITIQKDNFFELIKNDKYIDHVILMNFISELANKLRKSNEIIEDLRKKIPPG